MAIRVANVIEEGKLGGPQVRMVRVAAALVGRVDTLIVMPRTNSRPFREMCEAHGVPFRILPLTRITKEWRAALAYLFFSPWEVLRLAWLFRREGIDLVHASGGSWQYKAVLAARLAGVPSVWHLNDTKMPGWVRRLFALLSPLPAGFIFASHRSLAYYGSRLSDRLHDVIPSTVDVSHFDPDLTHAGDDEVIARLGSAPVIGTVANVNPIKGLETLIRMAGALRGRVPDLRVVVLGPVHANQVAYHSELLALADELGVGDAIEWAGGRSDVRPLLARFDVYVCTSLAESSPVSVWEAMAMARPVVSTDVGDVSCHMVDGGSGFIVPVGDHEALAERVHRLVEDSGMAARFGARGRREAGDAFSPARIAEKTCAAYRRALEAAHGHGARTHD